MVKRQVSGNDLDDENDDDSRVRTGGRVASNNADRCGKEPSTIDGSWHAVPSGDISRDRRSLLRATKAVLSMGSCDRAENG